MGANQSIDVAHVRIYQNVLNIQNPAKRQEILETLLAGNEYIISAKKANIYGQLLSHLQALRRGVPPPPLPSLIGSGVGGGGVGGGGGGSGSSSNRATALPSQTQITQAKIETKVRTPNQKNSQKALSFFSSCLRVLGLQEEVALTEDALKKAYKKAAISAHPDKGGSEEQFESITRAYAYLSEIIKLVKGQRTKDGEQAALPDLENVNKQRRDESVNFQQAEPVRLNPKNLNMKSFNELFDKTRIPDPDEDGYGDWLKSEDKGSTSQKKFSGKFNRTVFNEMFEDEARMGSSQQISLRSPEALILQTSSGIELGRDRPETYTAPANANLHYTDLKQAYTKDNTFSGEVSGLRVENRSLETYRASRDRAPDVYNEDERRAIEEYEAKQANYERNRQLRAAQEHVTANDYFERMKRLVIRDQ